MTDMTIAHLSKTTTGTLVCLVGVLTLTPDTLLIRAMGDFHPPTLLFYRYGLHAFSILSYVFFENGKETLSTLVDMGWIGILCGLIFGTSNIFFTTAVQYTAAANVLVILAINPLFAALFSWILLGDIIKLRTVITMLIGLGAISLIFYDEITGGSSSRSILGNIFACCTCVLMGLFFAIVRYADVKERTRINMIPCNVVAGGFVAVVALIIGAKPGSHDLWDLPSSPANLIYLLLQGLVVLPVSFGLLTLAPRFLSAPEVSLFLLIETCLGPLWVYLGGYEAPPPNTLLGGSVLIIALAVHSYFAVQEDQALQFSNRSTKPSDTVESVASSGEDNQLVATYARIKRVDDAGEEIANEINENKGDMAMLDMEAATSGGTVALHREVITEQL